MNFQLLNWDIFFRFVSYACNCRTLNMSTNETLSYVSSSEDAHTFSDGGGGDADTVIKSPPVLSTEASEVKNTPTETPSEDVSEQESISEKASALKEHDVPEEESAEAEKLKNALDKELEENDGWLKILGNDEIMKKVSIWSCNLMASY